MSEPVEAVLFANRLMSTPEQVQAFDEALARVPGSGVDLRALHRVFDDATKHFEVMYGLVHVLEAFDAHEQLAALVAEAPVMRDRAPGWLRTLLVGALNHSAAREVLLQLVGSTMPAIQSALTEISVSKAPVATHAKAALLKMRG